MTHRLTVVLTLLSIFVIVHVCLLEPWKHPLFGDVKPKVANSTIPSLVDTQNVSSISSSSHLNLDQLQGVTIVDGNASSSSSYLYQPWDNTSVTNVSRTSATVANNSKPTRKQITKKNGIKKTSTCCLRPSIDLKKKFTPEFFENERNAIDDKPKWTGREYEEWVSISARLNPKHLSQSELDCPTQYSLLVLDQVNGYFLRTVLNELDKGKLGTFPYNKEKPGLPRILLLGDSISRGIRSRTQQLYKDQANIQGAPANSMGFEKYQSGLKDWLGYCPWDLVQFNVGMHFHPEFPDNYTSWHEEYRQGIIDIANEIRAHSPSAKIVFALTTPSPFDSKATMPDQATCPHYDKFHKAGFVSAMNEIAISVAEELGVIINDRYSFILPVLEKYQNKCDVHFGSEGSMLMAKQDWKVIAASLALGKDRHQASSTKTSRAS